MGTRSLTYILDEDDQTLCQIYRQFDGYPSGQGQALYDVLHGRHLVNGISCDDYEKEERWPFNSMGCLAAEVVKTLKNRIGDIYLRPPTPIERLPITAEECWAEWVYVIYPGKGKDWQTIHVAVYKGSKKSFDGLVNEMGEQFGLAAPALPLEPNPETGSPVQ